MTEQQTEQPAINSPRSARKGNVYVLYLIPEMRKEVVAAPSLELFKVRLGGAVSNLV